MIIDFHSHILPCIDDGSQNIETSLAMLQKETDDGVSIVIATPHYYPEEQSIESFLHNRDLSYTHLINASQDANIPSIKLGAEVLYSPILNQLENLHDLCIDGTDYLLLELPYMQLHSKLIDDIERLTYNPNISIIIAHVERYLQFTSWDSIEEIMDMDVLGQVNASSLLNSNSKKNAIKVIRNDMAHVIGTDAHNVDLRPPLMREAERLLYKKVSKNIFNIFMNNAKMILHNEDISNIY